MAEMTPREMYRLIPKCRPYPYDLERKFRVLTHMKINGITSVSSLAKRLGMSVSAINEVINGTRLSRKTEERIAAFFGMRREELFLQRTLGELAEMNRAQLEAKQRRESC